MAQSILIVDNEPDLRNIYNLCLEAEKCQTFEAGTAEEARTIVETELPDLVLLDLGLPDEDGISVLKWLREKYPLIEAVIISGTGSIEKALESVRLGAFDYLEKPVDVDRLIVTARNALSRASLSKEKADIKGDMKRYTQIIGNSTGMKKVYNLIIKAAPTDASVLIQGESGTGKELVAGAIHRGSKRSKKPYIRLNCATIPQNLIESELFGLVKGSFTGATESKVGKIERADGGTLLLDEIGDMTTLTQAKVLRFLEEGEIERVGGGSTQKIVDVRIISATNKILEDEIKEKNFRSDLFFRLNVINIQIPPLRDRREDIPSLAIHLIDKLGMKKGFKIQGIDQDALDKLQEHDWPGNVRELENVIERSIIFCKGDSISANDLFQLRAMKSVLVTPPTTLTTYSGSLNDQIDLHMREIIINTLEAYNWNQSKAAAKLGLHRNTLISKMKKLQISRFES